MDILESRFIYYPPEKHDLLHFITLLPIEYKFSSIPIVLHNKWITNLRPKYIKTKMKIKCCGNRKRKIWINVFVFKSYKWYFKKYARF